VTLLDIYVIITLGCWSIWGILDKKALETSNHLGVLFRIYICGLWQIPAIWLYMNATAPGWSIASGAWMWTGIAAVFQMVSLLAYLVAMGITDASLVLGVTASYPVVTQFLAAMFLNEPVLPMRTLGSAGIAIGVLFIGASFDGKKEALTTRQKVMLAVSLFVATFGWGIWGIFDKKAIGYGTPMEIWMAESLWEVLVCVVAIVGVIVFRVPCEWKDKRAWIYSFISSVSLGTGRFTFLVALSMSAASYVIAITGCYPLFMYFLALVFLKEKFSKMRLAGILLIVAGGIAVQGSLS
jgi:drug/metabolite transporter (DMT)-like permease